MKSYLSKSAPGAKIFPTASGCVRPRAHQHSHRRARPKFPTPFSMPTLLRPRMGALHFGSGSAGLVWCLRNNYTFAAMDFGRRLGASDEHIPKWICEEQATTPPPKRHAALWVALKLAWGFVARSVEYRWDTLPPSRLAQGQFERNECIAISETPH